MRVEVKKWHCPIIYDVKVKINGFASALFFLKIVFMFLAFSPKVQGLLLK